MSRWKSILEIFVEASQRPDGGAYEEIYNPPWHPSPSSRAEYGPTRLGTWRRLHEEWAASRPGGGLWDHSHTLPQAISAPPNTEAPARASGSTPVEVLAYLERYSASVPEQELAVGLAVYYNGMSRRAVGRKLGMSLAQVRHALLRLRRRVSGGS
jgi:hypothetical protein